MRQDAPGSLELGSSILFPRKVKSPALKPERFTRLRINHIAPEGYRLTGESKSANPGCPRFAFTHRARTLVLQWGLGGESPNASGEEVAPSPTCSTWNTSATGPEGEATRLPLIARGSLGPAGLAASGSRPTRVSPHGPASEPSEPSGSLVEVNALARRRHHRSPSCLRGGARETHVAQPKDPDAPCGQERRGVRSTHGARARPQDVSESLEALARELSSNRVLSRGERSYPSMSLAELRGRSRLRDSAALSMHPARCRNDTV